MPGYSSAVSNAIVYPIDVVTTRMQTHGKRGEAPH
jgi:hypothetical protein